jgi:hypothetical protein
MLILHSPAFIAKLPLQNIVLDALTKEIMEPFASPDEANAFWKTTNTCLLMLHDDDHIQPCYSRSSSYLPRLCMM